MTRIPTPGEPVRGSKSGAPIMALFDLLGRRWAMGVLWVLSQEEPCTFRQLQEACETISPAVLNTRLKELRAAKLIDVSADGYVLSPLGRSLHPLLTPMAKWANNWAKALAKS